MDNARDKMVAQVQLPGYQAFLQYACPGFDVSGASVPPGDDLEACPRPILGAPSACLGTGGWMPAVVELLGMPL